MYPCFLQTCNNDRYLIIDRFVMKYMYERYVTRPVPEHDSWASLKPSTGYDKETVTLSNGIHLQVNSEICIVRQLPIGLNAPTSNWVKFGDITTLDSDFHL